MKYLNTYKLFESNIDDLLSCIIDLTDMGFEPEERKLIQTGEIKRLALMQRKDKSVHHEQDLILAVKLVKRTSEEIYGYFEETFDNHNFNIPIIINPNNPETMHRFEFTDFEKELLDVIKDSVNKISNIYLEDDVHGKYSVNQYHTSYGSCIVLLLKFYK